MGGITSEAEAVVAQQARHFLLEGNWDSMVLVAEDIHAREIMPWFVGAGSFEDRARGVCQFGDPFLLLVGREIVVEGICCVVGMAVVVLFFFQPFESACILVYITHKNTKG